MAPISQHGQARKTAPLHTMNKGGRTYETNLGLKVKIYVDNYEKAKPSMYLYESDRATYHSMRLVYDSNTENYYYEFVPEYEGIYFIKTKSYEEDVIGYSILIEQEKIELTPVGNLKATSAGKNRVKLTWTAVAGAEGYLVYGQKNGKYAYVGMTTKGTTYTDTKALDSDYNFYWVFPYVKDSNGKMITGECTKYVYAKGVCPAVTNLKASSVTGGVKLTWTAAAGAEGYLVYGIENGGAYGYVGMTKGKTFTAKKASKDVYNFYWIFPYHKDVNGKMITGGVAPYTYGRAK